MKVYITINGNPVEDLYMQLGEAGEAVFIEEDTVNKILFSYIKKNLNLIH